MAKYCYKCGAELAADTEFCGSCGAKFEEKPVQPLGYTPMGQPSRKSNKKIIAVVAVVVAIVVIAAVVLILFTGGSSSKFVGTWNIQSGGGSTFTGTMIFESNGDLKTGYSGYQMTIGKWSTEGSTVCFEYSFMGTSYPKICCNYSFSDGGNTLTINDPTGGGNNLVLTK